MPGRRICCLDHPNKPWEECSYGAQEGAFCPHWKTCRRAQISQDGSSRVVLICKISAGTDGKENALNLYIDPPGGRRRRALLEVQ